MYEFLPLQRRPLRSLPALNFAQRILTLELRLLVTKVVKCYLNKRLRMTLTCLYC